MVQLFHLIAEINHLASQIVTDSVKFETWLEVFSYGYICNFFYPETQSLI